MQGAKICRDQKLRGFALLRQGVRYHTKQCSWLGCLLRAMRYDAKTAAISQTKELNVHLCTVEQVESVRKKKKEHPATPCLF